MERETPTDVQAKYNVENMRPLTDRQHLPDDKSSKRADSAAQPGAGKSIVIVGGGLAGLTAAFEALTYGFRVTLYEREAELGGKLAGGVDSQNGFSEHAWRAVRTNSYFAFFDVFDRLGLDRQRVLTPLMAAARTGKEILPYYDKNGRRVIAASMFRHAMGRRAFGELWSLLRRMLRLVRLFTASPPDKGPSFGTQFALADVAKGTLSHHLLVGAARVASGVDIAESRLASVASFLLPDLYPDPGGGRTLTSRKNWSATIVAPLVEHLQKQYGARFTVRLRRSLTAVEADRNNPNRVASMDFSDAGLAGNGGSSAGEPADYYVFCLPRPELVRLGILEPDHVAGMPLWTFCVDINLKRIPPRLATAVDQMLGFVEAPWAVMAILFLPPGMSEIGGAGFTFSDEVAKSLPPAVRGVLRIAVSNVKTPGERVRKPFLCCTPEEALDEMLAQIGGGGEFFDLNLDEDIFAVNWGPGVEYTSGARELYLQQQKQEPRYTYGPYLEHEQGWWRSKYTLDNQRHDEAFTTATSGRFANARIAGEAVLDRHDHGVNLPTMETAIRSGKYAIQSIMEAEGSDARIYPFDRPLYGRRFKLARWVFGALPSKSCHG